MEFVAVVVGLAVLMVYGLQLLVMRQTFEMANKPLIGVNGFTIEHQGRDKDGNELRSKTKIPGTRFLSFNV